MWKLISISSGFTGRRKLSEILNYRAGNATEKNLMQEEFVNLQKRLTKEEKADVYYQIQSDAEVNLAQFESVAHDPVYEPDAEDETACTANDDPSECKGGSTNSNRRKKYREMKEIFELTKTKRERLADNKQIGAGLLSVIQDRQISTRNSQTMRNKAENYIKSITATTDDEERKTLIKNMKKDFTNKREGCCYDNTNSVVIKKAIESYIKSAEMLDIENNKQKAQDALDRAIFLSDSDKEKFQNFIDANENDQTEEGIKEREEAKEKAAKKLDSVKQQRNRQAYNKGKDFLKRLYNGGESGTGTGNDMNPAKRPKHYGRRFARTFRSSSTTSKINGFTNGLNTALQSLDNLKSDDPLEVASGVMDITGSITAFMGPYGAAFSAVLGVLTTFFGIASKGPSQTEVMTNLINDRTEIIVDKIDENTKVVLETLKTLAAANVESIVTSLEQESWRDMIHEMNGATNSLTAKKDHLEQYRSSCILDWVEIAFESDLQHITKSLGKVSSFMTWYPNTHSFQMITYVYSFYRYCFSRKNIPFCGDMIFQYVMLANLRNAVKAETILIVRNSNIHNGRNKLNGLLAEYHTELNNDKKLLTKILQAYDQKDPDWNLLCFATCTFNKVQDKFENDNLEGSPDMKLSKPQKNFINQYMAQVNSSIMQIIQVAIPLILQLGVEEDFADFDKPEKLDIVTNGFEGSKEVPDIFYSPGKEMCRVCYKDTPCKRGFERGPVSNKCENPRSKVCMNLS